MTSCGITKSVTPLVLTQDDIVLWNCHRMSVSAQCFGGQTTCLVTRTIWLQLWRNREPSLTISVNCLLMYMWLSICTVSVHIMPRSVLCVCMLRSPKNVLFTSWWHIWPSVLRRRKEMLEQDVGIYLNLIRDLWSFLSVHQSEFRKLAVKSMASSRSSWKGSLFLCSHFKQSSSSFLCWAACE